MKEQVTAPECRDFESRIGHHESADPNELNLQLYENRRSNLIYTACRIFTSSKMMLHLCGKDGRWEIYLCVTLNHPPQQEAHTSGLKLKRQRMREKENIKDIEIIEKSMGF